VLVVEDNPLNMQLVTDLLEVYGYQVLQAQTAEQGIEAARKEMPDLILMDIGLPGMDGLEASRILKNDKSTQKILIIALTAHAMHGDREKAMEYCDGYISKPINTTSFPGIVADVINSSKDRGALP